MNGIFSAQAADPAGKCTGTRGIRGLLKLGFDKFIRNEIDDDCHRNFRLAQIVHWKGSIHTMGEQLTIENTSTSSSWSRRGNRGTGQHPRYAFNISQTAVHTKISIERRQTYRAERIANLSGHLQMAAELPWGVGQHSLGEGCHSQE